MIWSCQTPKRMIKNGIFTCIISFNFPLISLFVFIILDKGYQQEGPLSYGQLRAAHAQAAAAHRDRRCRRTGQTAETLILRRFSLTEHVLKFIKTTQDLHVLIQKPVTFKSRLIGCFNPTVLEEVFEAHFLTHTDVFFFFVLSFLSFFKTCHMGFVMVSQTCGGLGSASLQVQFGILTRRKTGTTNQKDINYVFIFLALPLSLGPPRVHFLRLPSRLGVGIVNNLKLFWFSLMIHIP